MTKKAFFLSDDLKVGELVLNPSQSVLILIIMWTSNGFTLYLMTSKSGNTCQAACFGNISSIQTFQTNYEK